LIRVRILVPVPNNLKIKNVFKFLNVIMNKISTYFRESYTELTEKVTWPSWIQLQQSTVIVLVATIIITALVWVMDFASQNLLKAIYSLFK
jgi:preprotein translocase subunit SecE